MPKARPRAHRTAAAVERKTLLAVAAPARPHEPPSSDLPSSDLPSTEPSATPASLRDVGLYQRVLETMQEGAASLSAAGTLTYANRGLCEMLGRSAQQLRNSMLQQHVVQDKELVQALVSEAHAAPREAQMMLRRSDGSVFPARLSLSPLGPGQSDALCLVVSDVSHQQGKQEAQAAERLARSILEQAAEAVVVCDADGRIIRASAKAHELCAHDPLFQRFEAAFPLHFETSTLRGRSLSLDYVLAGNVIRGAEARLMRPCAGGDALCDSPSFQLVSAAPLRSERGDPLGCVISLSDITRLKRTEEELRLAADALANTADGVVITDSRGIVVSVNKAYSHISGVEAHEAVGRPLLEATRIGEGLPPEVWSEVETKGRWQGELWTRHKSGRRFPISLSVSAVNDETSGARHCVAVMADISRRKRDEERLAHLAHHDTLTELPNRTLLQERFAAAVARADACADTHAGTSAGQVTLLYIDLDGFKAVNDSLGHEAGDQLLQAVARRFSARVREQDMVARLGGDEFAILLHELGADDAATVAQNLAEGLKEPFSVAGHTLYVSASIGISCYPQDGREVATLLKHADVAMYRAKQQGRGTYRFFRPEMNARALDRLVMANELHQALARSQFVLNYQPCVDLCSGLVTSVEALLRWDHPTLGRVPPERFIPLAEETDVIRSTGDWVLRTACAQAKRWQEAGLAPIPMGVNLSARQFNRPRLVEQVLSALNETGLDPQWLKLEITESCMMDSPEYAGRILRRLADSGVRIAVDDFGTGYSSLSYLKHFPIHYLKIDKSFVNGLPGDADDAAITDTMIAMAKGLHLKIIAEGIETAGQRDFLREHGCEEGQGFLFSRPLSHAHAQALLEGEHSFVPTPVHLTHEHRPAP